MLVNRGIDPHGLRRYLYRSFDLRWLYWESETQLLDEKRAETVQHIFDDNIWLVTQLKPRRDWSPPLVTRVLGDLVVMDPSTSFVPLYLAPDLLSRGVKRANIGPRAESYLTGLKAVPDDLFYHILATLHAPAFHADHADALRQDWPRVPLPGSLETLLASATLGRTVAALLDVDIPVPGVTCEAIRAELRVIAAPARIDGEQLDDTRGDLRVTLRWGSYGGAKQIMPGKDFSRPCPLPKNLPAKLGPGAVEVPWNEDAMWTAVPVPVRVWAYTMGGYPVLKKWLSYRAEPVLHRALREDEVEAFANIARRIAALLLLESDLNAAYLANRTA
jgi:hypothetical protein